MLNQEVTPWTSFKALLYGQQWLIQHFVMVTEVPTVNKTFYYFNYTVVMHKRHLIDRVYSHLGSILSF